MKARSRITREMIAQGCFLFVAVIASVMLILWVIGQWWIGTFGADYVPMAPSTALVFLVLAGSAFLSQRSADSSAGQRIGLVAGVSVLAMSLLLGSQMVIGFQLPLEEWLSRTTQTIGQIPVGRMSPLTAAAFLFSGLTLLLRNLLWSRHQATDQLASVLAVLLLLFSGGIALSYALDQPLLSGGTTVPMAALTAMGFIFISMGLLLGGAPNNWPLNIFMLDHAQALNQRRIVRGFSILVLLGIVAIFTIGRFYFVSHRDAARAAAEESLSTIADLKVGQIAYWINERHADVATNYNNPLAQELLDQPDDPVFRKALMLWLNSIQQAYGYREVILFDSRAEVVLAAASSHMPSEYYTEHIQAALLARGVVTDDLHRHNPDEPIKMNFIVPIGIKPELGQRADGALLFVIDPEVFLYSLLQKWPTSSPSAETLIVRREGDEVVFLNRLRHRADAALMLRIGIVSNPQLPAVMAVEGKEGVVEGLDYRDVMVLAAIRKIPGTPWFMVAKVDLDEIYTPLRQDFRIAGLVFGLLLLVAMLGVGMLWRQQKLIYSRRELSERRQAEAQLHANEELWKFALEGSQDGVWDLDFPTQKIVCSERLAAMLGYEVSEVATDYREFKKLIHPEDIDGAVEILGHYLEDPSSTFAVEHRMRCQDGTYKWILVRGMVFSHDANGQPVRMVGTTTDITERKDSEFQLRKLSNIIEQAPLSIVITDLTGAIEYSNPRFTQVTGYSKEEAIGQNPRILKSGETTHEVYETMWKTLARGKVWSGELINRRKNGEVYLETAVIAPIFDDQGKITHYAALKDDITAQKRREDDAAAKLANEQVISEMKTRFISVTSHQFRTPMAAAMASAELLANHLDELSAEKRKNLLGRINSSLNRMTVMLDEVLLISRIDAKRLEVRPSKVNLSVFINDLVAGVEAGDSAHHRFEIQDDSGTEMFMTDANLLNQIVENLLSNAVRYSPEDSLISVRLSLKNNALELSVKDQGLGIPLEDRERIFEAFERGSNVGSIKGTGLGLNIVKRMTEMLSGTITLECPEGGGSCFTLTLPQRPQS